ncbi:MAG: fibronectin type III domain-containing protein [Bacilli bacterium]
MKRNTRIILLCVLGVLIIITIVLGVTYSFMRPINETSSETKVSLNACANLTLKDTDTVVELSNSYPMSKNKALQTTPYTFTLTSSCGDRTAYSIYLATLNTNTLADNNIHYILTKSGSKEIITEGILSNATNAISEFNSYEQSELNTGINGTFSKIYKIYFNGISKDEEQEYDLYLYVDESVTDTSTMNKTFKAGVAAKVQDYTFASVTNVTTSNITTNSITISATATNGANPISKYYFSNGEDYIDNGNNNTYTFNNLSPGTEYTFSVYVVDSLGITSQSYSVKANTVAYTNPTVNSVTITDTTTSSISISVSASGGTNNVATYYYSINNGAYSSSTSNTKTFTGLSKGTTYTIKVYVKDTNGVDSSVYTTSVETESAVLLADYIKGLYTSQGTNGLYYHTSSLANSAADNSYRYAGANPNNYVCFGSTASTCPSDNLYRIIGVFKNNNVTDDNYGNFEVKLIKNSSLGNYYWSGSSSNRSNTWSSSTLNTGTLNGTYLSGLSATWSNKIITHTWNVGGINDQQMYLYTAKQYYDFEVGSSSSSTTDRMKIGLMYVSDYGYAASNNYWTKELYNYEPAKSSNWLAGLTEWTISRRSVGSDFAFYVDSSGYVADLSVYSGSSDVRPVFYLTSSTSYVSGSGSSADPIRIN